MLILFEIENVAFGNQLKMIETNDTDGSCDLSLFVQDRSCFVMKTFLQYLTEGYFNSQLI